MKRIFLSFSLGIFSVFLFGQTTVTGFVKSADTDENIGGATVKIQNLSVQTDQTGFFKIQSEELEGEFTLEASIFDYDPVQLTLTVNKGETIEVGTIILKPTVTKILEDGEDRIPTISLDSDQSSSQLDDQNISGILTASQDVFVQAAAYTFGPNRFRIRGYDSENTLVSINGVPMNELENGRVFWNAWTGLNDVTRNRQNSIGLDPVSFSFGGVGGASDIDVRASNQRKQTRMSYAISNRTYRNRAMITHSTGVNPKGWAFSFSGSRSWGDEGYIDATSYDGFSYYAAADKKYGGNNIVSLAIIGSRIERGRSTASTQEDYDLGGGNFYNPNWGYQNGEKRNSRVQLSHQPIILLTNDWNINETSKLTAAISYQFGRNGGTALDWLNARDPRPNYYRNLPSFLYRTYPENPELGDALTDDIQSGAKSLQLDWAELYEANRTGIDVIHNPNGALGTTAAGFLAHYKIEDRRFDSEEVNGNILYENVINDNLTINAGVTIQRHKQHTFKKIVDLMDADFAMDWDNFSERDFFQTIPADQQVLFSDLQEEIFLDNDVRNPNRLLYEGDIFGYNYNLHMNRWTTWAQAQFSYEKVDFFLAANYNETTFWREGLFQNGRFPINSLGEGERNNFKNYSVKGGATYKIDGRNYLYVNAMRQTRAPFARHAFISPRTRHDIVPNLESEKITAFDGGYLLRGVNVKGRASAYFTQLNDQTEIIRYFTETGIGQTGFFNYVMTNIDLRHLGTEFGVEVKVLPSLSLSAVAAYGQYFHTSRPIRSGYNDTVRGNVLDTEDNQVYAKNLRKAGTPQQAYTFEITWNPKEIQLFGNGRRFFGSLNFNYFDDIYLDFAPERRTFNTLEGLDQNGETFQSLISQDKFEAAFTMDFFGGISFSRNLWLNIGVNNLLDKTDFRTGGFEQARLDFSSRDVANSFAPRYFYSFGRNYFISLVYRI